MSDDQTRQQEIEKLKTAVASLNALRGTLENTAVDAQIAPLQARIDQLTQTNIHSEGGAVVGHDVRVDQGDFIGRDKHETHHHYYQYAPENEAAKALRENYLHEMVRRQNDFGLSGIDPQTAVGQNSALRLDAVYTALNVQPQARLDLDRAALMMTMLRDKEEHVRVIPALQHLQEEPHAVLLGAPGSGKSTFVRFTAACMAGELTKPQGK